MLQKCRASTPCLLCRENQCFISIDQIPLFEVQSEEIVVALLAVYYVFNITYPKECTQIFSLLEYIFLKVKPSKQGNTFARVFSKLYSL